MADMSKLQIRAKVLSVVSEIKTLREYNEAILLQFYKELEDINDRHTIFDVILKEYLKMDENQFIFTGCLIKEIVEVDYIQDKVFELLKSANYSDEAKYKLVQLLRISNCDFDYNDVPQYFDNPSDVVDADTKKLLQKAVFNPEAMLDFLDFVSAVGDNDRNILLQSLQQDYQGDMLANIVYPILYADFDDKFKLKAIEILTEAKSSLAIAPFKYLIQVSSNQEIISACNIGLKKLKLSGASEKKAEDYFKNIINNTVPYSFYTTIPDGNANQAFLISRMNKDDNSFMLSAVVINDVYGVEDCFGFFNISKDELSKIVDKFNKTQGQFRVNPSYVKTRIDEAFDVSVKNKRSLPYEFICWDTLLKDIMPFPNGIWDEISKEITPSTLTKKELLVLLTKGYSFRWYIKPSENAVLESIVDSIINLDSLDIDKINSLLIDNEKNLFDETTVKHWKNRILQCAYLLYTNSFNEDASAFYSLLSDEDNFHVFKMVIMQRSVFNYFFSLKEKEKESVLPVNIFRRKQIEKEKIDIKKIAKILDFLSRNWINE